MILKMCQLVVWDMDISNIPNFTWVIFPANLSNIIYELVFLWKNVNVVWDLKVLNIESIIKLVEEWQFNYRDYIYMLNKISSKNVIIPDDTYKLKKYKNWNQFIYWEFNWFFDYLSMSYDWYIYSTTFHIDPEDQHNSKSMIENNMNLLKIINPLYVNEDLGKFSFWQTTKKDLDWKWYVYENSLRAWTYDDNWLQYDIVSRNKNVSVENWNIILKNSKTDWHINLAQTINFSPDMLNKKFSFNFDVPVDYSSSYSVKLIVWKYFKDSDTIYYDKKYPIMYFENNLTTDTIWDVIDLWRKENWFTVNYFPDIVRISIWIDNTTWWDKSIKINDIKLTK